MIEYRKDARTGFVTIWVGGKQVPNDPEKILAAKRSLMIVSRRQARLALGESNCEILDQAANNTQLPWSLRENIRSATEWHRNSQEIDELKWLLDLEDEEVDALFEKAMNL